MLPTAIPRRSTCKQERVGEDSVIRVRWARLGAWFFAAATLISVGRPSLAVDWPTRPVRFLVVLCAASGVDIGARLFADRLSAQWKQPIVVENRPGGDGILAITSFLSAHDDHTVLVTPVAAFTAHPYFHNPVPYDAKELSPIARISK